MTRDSGYIYGLGWTQRILGRIARHSGDLVAAGACLQETIGTFEDMGAPFEASRTHLELSEVLEAAGDSDGARRHAETALASLETLGLQRFVVQARAALERLASHTLKSGNRQACRFGIGHVAMLSNPGSTRTCATGWAPNLAPGATAPMPCAQHVER